MTVIRLDGRVETRTVTILGADPETVMVRPEGRPESEASVRTVDGLTFTMRDEGRGWRPDPAMPVTLADGTRAIPARGNPDLWRYASRLARLYLRKTGLRADPEWTR